MNPEFGRILIVDDETTFLQATAELLRRSGFQVDAAEDGTAAMALVAEHAYDAIVSDILMPGNDDLAFVRQAAERDPGVQVILVTAYPDVKTAMAALRLPVAAYLVKPVDFPELLAQVRAVAGQAQLRRALHLSRERQALWTLNLEAIQSRSRMSRPQNPTLEILHLAMGNLAGTMLDMESLLQLAEGGEHSPQTCAVLQCPRLGEQRKVIEECLATLEKTRTAFKSRSLAEVRQRLEGLLRP